MHNGWQSMKTSQNGQGFMVEGGGVAGCLGTWHAPFSFLFTETLQWALPRSGVEVISLHPMPLLSASTQSQPAHLSPSHGGTGLEREPILSIRSFRLKAPGFFVCLFLIHLSFIGTLFILVSKFL